MIRVHPHLVSSGHEENIRPPHQSLRILTQRHPFAAEPRTFNPVLCDALLIEVLGTVSQALFYVQRSLHLVVGHDGPGDELARQLDPVPGFEVDGQRADTSFMRIDISHSLARSIPDCLEDGVVGLADP